MSVSSGANDSSLGSVNFDPGDIVYFLVVTGIFLSILYTGSTSLPTITTNQVVIVVFYIIIIFLYLIFLASYYVKINMHTVMIGIFGLFLFSMVAASLILFFGSDMCGVSGTGTGTQGLLYAVAMIMLLVAGYLGIHNHSDITKYTATDTLHIIMALILIRLVYYIGEQTSEDTTIYPMANFVMVLIIFFNAQRFYYLATKNS